ncbi:beta-ketoacyl synthase N-terminal-like domain-containing protein [Streptomyces sp. NPDC050636]|uniref:beta-ketoacyl synthase N-terminal-like domain-containing protein n=1 Tax=Streptomyces sp. NPDC050636 TaxID=3154510 RepID=UPI003413AC3B
MSGNDVDRRLARDPVAIVGLAGMFPEARDLSEFWDNVVEGRDCTTDVPDAWWKTADHYDPDPFAPDKTYARRGGFLSPAVFDPLEFGMPPNTVDSTGLVQLLSLMVARDVLRDAGCDQAKGYDPARTGVVLGVCGTNSTLIPLAARLLTPAIIEAMRAYGLPEAEAHQAARQYLEALPSWTEDSFPGILGNVVSGRVANRFNLGAANHTVDAACASSLTAARAAVDELLSRRADLMITGGCDADNSVVSFMCFSKTPALSPTGRVRPFDADADGTLIGEGIGMLALKRLADAERDGDRIYAVLRGLGGSSDGRAKSIYAPCGQGQLTALRRAYFDADCSPSSVELVEAHGTGTPAGDTVELATLDELMATPEDSHYVAVGSVKSQIGHTKAAAGAAGLIKTALALHHKLLPPTINVSRPSDSAVRDGGALYVNTAARPWILDPARPVRRAGVSAFGFGGVNHHAVLEEYRPGAGRSSAQPAGFQDPQVLHRTPRAHLWHAPTPQKLLARLESGAVPDDGPVPAGHARVGFVAGGPRGQEHYAKLLSTTVDQLRNTTGHDSWSHARGIHYRRTALPPGVKVGALFAGQGSQYVDMGLRALLDVPPLRAAFDDANALFPPEDTLARTVFPPPGHRDERRADERLRRTAYAQPAIAALAMGQYRFLAELGFAPHAVLGHSFGELTALWAAGSLGDEAFLALARARGRAMQSPPPGSTDPGAMAAVRVPEARLRQILAEHPEVAVCSRNAPDEQVVGGPTPAVERFVRWCAGQSVPVQRLPVAAAFHTAFVEHALDAFGADCAAVEFAEPRLRVYANTAGATYGQDPAANRRTLVAQLRHPVDFGARLEEMYADGVRVFVEFGPQRILTGLVERTLGDRGAEAVPCDIGGAADGTAVLKEAALRLAVLGLPLTGINRHDAPARPPHPAPSKVARLLEGPTFALEASRRAYEQRREDEGPATVPPPVPRTSQTPQPRVPAPSVPAAENDALSQAAAEHLTAHIRYLDGQLDTARQLTGLLAASAADGRVDETLTAAVGAITQHSLALGEAHTRAGEVVTRLLSLPQGGAAPPTGTAPHHLGATPTDPGTAELPGHQAWPAPSEHPAGRTPLIPRPGDESPRSARPASGTAGPRGPATSALAELLADQNGEGGSAQATMDMSEVDLEELEHVFHQVVAEKTGYDVDMIEPDLYIQEDLGIDSLKQVEIAAEVWRRYPVITRDELFRFSEARTVGELTDMLRKILTGSRPELQRADVIPLGRAFVTLRELPAVDIRTDAYADQPCALLLDDGGELCATVAESLRARGWRTSHLMLPGAHRGDCETWALEDWTETALAGRLAAVLAAASRIDLCVLPVGRDRDVTVDQLVTRLQHAILVAKHTFPVLEETTRDGSRAAFVTVTQLDGALGYAGAGDDPVAALAGGLGGLVKTLALESAPLFCRALDFAPELSAHTVGDAFAAEIADFATDVREVGLDGTRRRTPALSNTPAPLVPSPPETAQLGPDDVLLVTGGASGITAWCVTALAAEHPCSYLLLGRTPLTEDPDWAAGLDSPAALRGALAEQPRTAGEDDAARADQQVQEILDGRRIRAVLDELRSRGVEADYLAADVRDADALAGALTPHTARITGVIHAAGSLGDSPLADKTLESVARVVGTKLSGLHNVLDNVDRSQLRHLVVFSSVSGIWGNVRQSDYALANEAVNRYACAFKAAHPACRVTPVAWGPWAGGMAAPVQEIFLQQGIPVLARDVGCEYFTAQMRPDHSADGVVVIGPVTAPFHRSDSLPMAGLTALRALNGLEREPMLRDHCWAGAPLLPMTAAVGWGLHALESGRGGGRPVVECRDFRIHRGLYFDGSQPKQVVVRLVPDRAEASAEARVTVHSINHGQEEQAHYSGGFRSADRAPDSPCLELPPFRISEEHHASYGEGFLFHGPTLRGLRNVLAEEEGRLILAAQLPDPVLAHGAYAGQLYSPGLADLLLQAAALLGRQRHEESCAPVSVERVELFTPLPDDAPFAIVAELDSATALDLHCTITACAPDGKVHQRWTGLTLVSLTQSQMAARMTAHGRRAPVGGTA